MGTPRVLVLQTDGTNCDKETAYAFKLAGGNPRIVHVNRLRNHADFFSNYDILVIPGGFSYGDDIASGAVLANELISFLRDPLQEFVDSGRLVLGICNGFQVLKRTGLLPFGTTGESQASLVANDSGKFECRWIKLCMAYDSPCVFTKGLVGQILDLPVAHAEGKLVTSEPNLNLMHEQGLAPLRYYEDGFSAMHYPANPNGSQNAIAGVCDKTGRVFGLMPHPERFVEETQHPNWRRGIKGPPHGLIFFQNAVNFARN